MGIVQKDALRTTVISYLGLVLGYLNKGVLFIWFLTTEEIGLVNLLVAVGLLFGNLSGLGSPYAIWRFFPFLRNKERNHHGLLLLTLLISIGGGLLFTLIAFLFQNEIVELYKEKSAPFVHYYYWIIPLGFANLLYVIFDTFLRSLYHNVISVFVYEFLLRLTISVLLVLYGFKWINFDAFLLLHCVVYFMPVLVLGIYLKRIGQFSLSFKSISVPKRFRRIIVSFSLFSYLNSVGNLVVTTMDAMMIASMLGLDATAIYTTVVYLTGALQIPFKSMVRVSVPIVSDLWKERNMVEMSKLYKKFSSVNLVISLTMFMFIWICREELFHFLPQEFHEGIWVFLFLMIGRLTDMYFGLNGIILSMSKKYQYDIIFTAALIFIVWGLNKVLIPIYGISGSAIATCTAYVAYNIGRIIFVYSSYKIHPFERSQLFVLALFGGVVAFFELTPLPYFGDVLSILMKWTIFTIVFIAPIYFLKLEPEIVRYVDNGAMFLKGRIKRKG